MSTVRALRGNGRKSLRAMVLSHSIVCLAPKVMIILSKTKSLTCAGLSAPVGQSCDLERRATTCLLNSWSSRCNKSKTKPRSSLEPMLCIQLARRSGESPPNMLGAEISICDRKCMSIPRAFREVHLEEMSIAMYHLSEVLMHCHV